MQLDLEEYLASMPIISPLTELASHDLVYLATPYSKYKDGIHAAYEEACRIAAELLKKGVKVYSPIAHTHSIAMVGDIDPLDHGIWLPFDEAIMRQCSAMCIAKMDGWLQSYGLDQEVKFFRRARKPVFTVESDGRLVENIT